MSRRGAWTLLTANAKLWLVYGFLIQHRLLGTARLLRIPCPVIAFWRTLKVRSASRRALHPAPTERQAR